MGVKGRGPIFTNFTREIPLNPSKHQLSLRRLQICNLAVS